MTIAELFVNLGIKGDGSANKALKGVKSGLGEVKSMSLEAKAAIIGVVYGLERMMSASAQQGTNLTNFGALTGLNTQKLQEYQYAARQAGIANEEMAGSIKGVQNSMTQALLGKGLPEGYASVASKTGLKEGDLRDTFKVMEKLQEYANITPPDVGAQMIKSFGVSEGVIAAMYRKAFRPEVFAKAPKYAEGELRSLDKVNVAWSNLGTKIQMAFGHWTSQNGGQVVKDIDKVTTSVIKLVTAFSNLATKLELLKKVGTIFEGWASMFNIIADVVDTNNKAETGTDKEKAAANKKIAEWKDGFKLAAEGAGLTLMDAIGGKYDKEQNEKVKKYLGSPGTTSTQTGNAQTINNQINMNFQHDGRDARKLGDATVKGINKVYRQNPAQSQAN